MQETILGGLNLPGDLPNITASRPQADAHMWPIAAVRVGIRDVLHDIGGRQGEAASVAAQRVMRLL